MADWPGGFVEKQSPNYKRPHFFTGENRPGQALSPTDAHAEPAERELYFRILAPRVACNVSETPSIVLATLGLLSSVEAIPLDPPCHGLIKEIKQNPINDVPQISYILQHRVEDW
jgi:hypothetical protein